MRILVTGGRGFIGSHLVRALQARGDEVSIIDLPDDVLTASLPNVDLVYHLAAVARVAKSYEDPMRTAEVNVGGALRIVQHYTGGTHDNVTVIVAGTLHRGPSPYAVSKLAMEKSIEHCAGSYFGGGDARVVRFGNVYGGGEGVIDKWMHANEIEIWGNGSTCKDFIHVDDVVAGLLNPSPKPVSNLCTGRLISLEELASHFDKHVSYRSPQPGDWSTEKVTPDYSTTWTVEKYIKSRS